MTACLNLSSVAMPMRCVVELDCNTFAIFLNSIQQYTAVVAAKVESHDAFPYLSVIWIQSLNSIAAIAQKHERSEVPNLPLPD